VLAISHRRQKLCGLKKRKKTGKRIRKRKKKSGKRPSTLVNLSPLFSFIIRISELSFVLKGFSAQWRLLFKVDTKRCFVIGRCLYDQYYVCKGL